MRSFDASSVARGQRAVASMTARDLECAGVIAADRSSDTADGPISVLAVRDSCHNHPPSG